MINPRDIGSSSASRNWVIPAAVILGATFVTEAASSTNVFGQQYNVGSLGFDQSESHGTANLEIEHYLQSLNDNTSVPDWCYDAVIRMKSLAEKENGWKGPDSVAPSQLSFEFALKLLYKLALEGVDRRPSIGLDYEGTFSFSWIDESINVDLTIYENGDYSFFASNGEAKFSVDDANVSNPLHSHLLSVLLS